MNRWRLLAAAIGVYAIALIATAPATLADAGLEQASAGRLRLAEAQGTLWSGSGLLEIRDAGGQAGIARDFSWRAVPLSLLRGHLAFEVAMEPASRRFPLTLSMSRLWTSDASIALPAAVLGMGVPRLAALGLTGEVRIHVANLSIARDSLVGHATLEWRAAGSSLTSVSPLGDYELDLYGEGKTVSAILRTIEGPVRLDGKGSWTHGARPVFLGMASVPPQHQQQLAPLLRLIAVERDAQKFEFRLD